MRSVQIEPRSCAVQLKSVTMRWLVAALILLLAWPAIHRSAGMFQADRIIRGEQTIESYSRAILHDPSNAILWWHRGRLQHYSIERVDIPNALRDYEKALALNNRLSQAWVDLADCYERTGREREAEAALENAFSVQTYSPLIRWQAGNYFLRRGNIPRMYECFRLASEYDIEKLVPAAELSWKADSNHAGILRTLVPDTLPANLRYLQFLADRNELDLARAVWNRIRENRIPNDFEYRAPMTFAYVDRLLADSRVEEAQEVWKDALRKAGEGIENSPAAADIKDRPILPANLVWNGSFEKEILQGGFDWRFPDMKEVQFRIDLSDRMDGLKSLKLIFENINISFAHLSEIIPTPKPGNYQLEYFLRTEGLTTDKRPYFAIQGYPDPAMISYQTEPFPESMPWSKLTFAFAVDSNCKAIQLVLRRDASSKFDNQIKGSLWLDGVSVRAVD
jgi:tetratricopeptide (TPR) repeat protein